MANYISKSEFLRDHCQYKMHYCNGQHIPSINEINSVDMKRNIRDKEPCEHFFEGKCTHPMNPKNKREDYAKPLYKLKKEANDGNKASIGATE